MVSPETSILQVLGSDPVLYSFTSALVREPYWKGNEAMTAT
jgi:hypothetical protein